MENVPTSDPVTTTGLVYLVKSSETMWLLPRVSTWACQGSQLKKISRVGPTNVLEIKRIEIKCWCRFQRSTIHEWSMDTSRNLQMFPNLASSFGTLGWYLQPIMSQYIWRFWIWENDDFYHADFEAQAIVGLQLVFHIIQLEAAFNGGLNGTPWQGCRVG